MLEKFLTILEGIAASLASIAKSPAEAKITNTPAAPAPAAPTPPPPAPAPVDDLGLGDDPTPPALDLKAVQAAARKVAENPAKGRAVVQSCIQKLGVTGTIKDIPKEKYAEFVKLLEAA